MLEKFAKGGVVCSGAVKPIGSREGVEFTIPVQVFERAVDARAASAKSLRDSIPEASLFTPRPDTSTSCRPGSFSGRRKSHLLQAFE